MLKIGLTGGIGSGKTTVAKVFETLGIPVYYADDAAKHLMNTDPTIRESILHHFGKDAYTEEKLNRKWLASVVFNDPAKLDLLNTIIHPATIRDAEQWIHQHETSRSSTYPYIIKEAALLFESGANKNLDYIVGVFAPEPIRIKRVMERDHVSEEEIRKRISRQMEEEKKMKLCDFIITNDDQQLVVPQIITLHQKLVK